jgi:hypothetical protein
MFTKRDGQESILNCDSQFLSIVGRETFYGFLSEHRHEIFPDDDFAFLYCKDNGRPSIAPSLLALGLLLQIYDKVSDDEAARRAHFDLQWQVALGVPVGSRPFAKSTLQLFRSQLILNEKARRLFMKSLAYARRIGFLKSRAMKIALDTTPVFGRGAVKDTYNLLADGIVALINVLARQDNTPSGDWAQTHDLSRYLASSIKATVSINWDSTTERNTFLRGIVADADRLILLAKDIRSDLPKGSSPRREITKAITLLAQLLGQDIERTKTGETKIKRGVAKDRIISVTDTQARHGRKSTHNRFNGHKAAIAVDTQSQLITAVDILPGNSHDHTGSLDLVAQTEENTAGTVSLTIGDCAYGDGGTRKEFQDAGRELLAKAPRAGQQEGKFSKDDFRISADTKSVICPKGHRTSTWRKGAQSGSGAYYRDFVFPKNKCRSCPLAAQCVKHPGKDHRIFHMHPQEDLLRQARRQQGTKTFQRTYRLRQTVEHRIARLSQLGIRQARYIGRTKTLFQLYMTALVANLTLIASSAAYSRVLTSLVALLMLFDLFIIIRKLRGSFERVFHQSSHKITNNNSALLKTGGLWARF